MKKVKILKTFQSIVLGEVFEGEQYNMDDKQANQLEKLGYVAFVIETKPVPKASIETKPLPKATRKTKKAK